MKKGRPLANAYLVLVFGFLYVPIAVLIAFSFNESKSRTVFTGFTFKWYQNLFHNDMVLKSLGVSLGVAFAAACIATVVGTLAAIGISSMNKRARGAVMAVSYVPVVNPEIITGVSLMLLFVVFNRQVSAALSWLLQREVDFQGFGLGTLLIAHITFCLPMSSSTSAPSCASWTRPFTTPRWTLAAIPGRRFSRWCCRSSRRPSCRRFSSASPIPLMISSFPISPPAPCRRCPSPFTA